MWKCKKCGGEITAEYTGSWIAFKKVINKNCETERIRNIDIEDLGGYIFQFHCEECGNFSENIEEIADWID